MPFIIIIIISIFVIIFISTLIAAGSHEWLGSDSCIAPAPAAGLLAQATTPGIILGLILGASLVLNAVLLICLCRRGRPQPQLEAPVAVAVSAPAAIRPRLRDVSTQSQTTYRRGPNARFTGAFHYEGLVGTYAPLT